MIDDSFFSNKSIIRVIDAMRRRRGGDPAESSEASFEVYMKRYLVFYAQKASRASITPDEIIAERKNDWISSDDDIRRRHEEMVTQFLNKLRTERYCNNCHGYGVEPETKKCCACGAVSVTLSERICSSGRIAAAFNAVRGFYRENYRPLDETLTAPAITVETQYKVPSRKEWQTVMNVCDYLKKLTGNLKWLELKTWILCDKDCGMSVIDLCHLTGKELSPQFGTVLEQLRKGLSPIHIRIIRQKTKASGLGFYDTFLGDESIKALQEFLPQRPRRFFNYGERAFEIDFARVETIVNQEYAKREEKGASVNYWNNFVPKSCRKWFSSEMKFAKVPLKPEYVLGANAIVEYMMGHSIKRQEGAYVVEKLREHPDELMRVYKDAYPSIRFYE